MEFIQPADDNQSAGKRMAMSAEPVRSNEKSGFIPLLRE